MSPNLATTANPFKENYEEQTDDYSDNDDESYDGTSETQDNDDWSDNDNEPIDHRTAKSDVDSEDDSDEEGENVDVVQPNVVSGQMSVYGSIEKVVGGRDDGAKLTESQRTATETDNDDETTENEKEKKLDEEEKDDEIIDDSQEEDGKLTTNQ
jgi:hypothetical protein